MPNRILKESIRTSKKVNALSDFDYRVWSYLITYVDDYGRGSADPELLKGIVFPRRKGITEAQIKKAIDNLASAGMVILYEVDDELYLYFPNWSKHQQIRAKKSKYPEPENICNQVISDDGNSPRNRESESNTESESESNTNSARASAIRFKPPTVEEVSDYCRERGNHVDPQRFVDYYTSNGWKVGRNTMKDWKAAVRTWEKNEGEGRSSHGHTQPTAPGNRGADRDAAWGIQSVKLD